MGVIIVAQATGQHGWSSLETYEAGVRALGLDCTVYRPRADWGAPAVQDDDGLAARLCAGGSEPLLLCGFDWHSQPLHQDPAMRRALRAHRGPRIGIFQEHLAADWIRQDPQLVSLFAAAAVSAAEVLTHVACNHEGDVEWLRALGLQLPITYLPFCADLQTFRRLRPMSQRDPRAFFRGKRMEFLASSPYAARDRMAELLRTHPHAVVADLQPAALLDREAMIRRYVEDLNHYRIQLNLPSVSDSLTCRPFEVLGCGGTLVQTEPEGEVSRALLPPDCYVPIDRRRPPSVVEAIDELRRHPAQAERLAERGHALVAGGHGAERRVSQLLGWATGALGESELVRQLTGRATTVATAAPATHADRAAGQPHILVDLVFYQYANTGIAQVWNRLLAEWAASGYARHVTLGVRRQSRYAPPAAVMSAFATVELPVHRFEGDAEQVQAACDAIGATLFMSTYYSRPTRTRSMLLVHDCIPERLNPACFAEPDWREKREAIEAASAYACVSEATARDLRECYATAVGTRPVYVAPNEFATRFAPADAPAREAFVQRAGLRREFLVVVGERVGYRGYKNVETLCRALGGLANAQPALAARYSLLFVGGAERGDSLSLEPALERHLRAWHLRRLTLDDEAIVTALSAATFLLYPSRIEGFGLPPGEAAMCGTPTIAWDTPINREIYGEDLAYLRDGDEAALGRQLSVYLEQAATWRQTARRLGERLRQQRAQRGGASQSGTLLECALLHAQRDLDLAAPGHEPVLFDAHPSQRAAWLQRLLERHPANRGVAGLGFGQEPLDSAALVSMYRGAEFVVGCVEDLIGQTAFEQGRMEVLLIDSASPDHEHRLVREHIRRHPNLLYVRSVDRESLYRAWNRGACVSQARYLSNANLDDRHRKDFFERLANDLDRHADVELVYPAQYLTSHANEPFSDHEPVRSWAWPDYTLDQLRIGNHVGSQPMWRRSLHQRIGWFEERYRIAGDYDFWCRIAHRAGPLKLHPVHVGLYYFNGTGIEHGDPLRSEVEVAEICRRYGIRKNYEVSQADVERAAQAAAQAPAKRELEDLQYNGMTLEREINVWIDAGRGLPDAMAIADTVLSQSVANQHRLRVVLVDRRWTEAQRREVQDRVLAPLARDFTAARDWLADDFAQPGVCTVRLHAALPADRGYLERAMRTLYEGRGDTMAMRHGERAVGSLSRSAPVARAEVFA